MDTLFNRAKSENKWMEAALVQVVTVASKVGHLKNALKMERQEFYVILWMNGKFQLKI